MSVPCDNNESNQFQRKKHSISSSWQQEEKRSIIIDLTDSVHVNHGVAKQFGEGGAYKGAIDMNNVSYFDVGVSGTFQKGWV